MHERTDMLVLQRCLRILRRLTTHRETTVSELYALFNKQVSMRTLQRDLERLSEANVPLTSRIGKGRELIWSLSGRYSEYIPQVLGDDEITAAVLINELSKVVFNTPLAEGVKHLQERLKEFLPVDILNAHKNNSLSTGTFFLAQNGIVDLRPFSKQIHNFVEATKLRQKITIVYRKPMEPGSNIYHVEPYGILFYGEALYAVARKDDHSRYLTLPFHRMQEVTIHHEQFKRNKEFKLDTFLLDRIGIFGDSQQEPIKIVLRFYPPVAHTIKERIWHPTQTIDLIEEGVILFTMNVVLSEELIAWILRWQKFVEVVSPETLQEWVRKALMETLQRYTGNQETAMAYS